MTEQPNVSAEALIVKGLGPTGGPGEPANAAASGAAGKATEKPAPVEKPEGTQPVEKPIVKGEPAALSREEVQKMIAEAVAKDRKTREVEDVRQNFLLTKLRNFPPEFFPLIPMTDNIDELYKAANKVSDVMQRWIAQAVANGHLQYVNLGASPGGQPPSAFVSRKAAPEAQIAAGLKSL